MKTQKNINEISDAISFNTLEVTDRQLFNSFSLPIWVAIAITISLGAVTQTASAENTGSNEGNRGYRYIPIVPESTAGSAGQSTTEASPAKGTNAKESPSSDQSATKSSPAKGTDAKESTSSDQTATESSPAKDTDAKDLTSGDQSATKSSPAKATDAKDLISGDQSAKKSSPAKGTDAKDSTSSGQSASESSTVKGIHDKEPTSGGLSAQAEPVIKPTDGRGLFPQFAEADIDGDHYITKYELKNYPYLLQVFDKVDAGKDGKLEQHEYQNLEMETKREGEVR